MEKGIRGTCARWWKGFWSLEYAETQPEREAAHYHRWVKWVLGIGFVVLIIITVLFAFCVIKGWGDYGNMVAAFLGGLVSLAAVFAVLAAFHQQRVELREMRSEFETTTKAVESQVQGLKDAELDRIFDRTLSTVFAHMEQACDPEHPRSNPKLCQQALVEPVEAKSTDLWVIFGRVFGPRNGSTNEPLWAALGELESFIGFVSTEYSDADACNRRLWMVRISFPPPHRFLLALYWAWRQHEHPHDANLTTRRIEQLRDLGFWDDLAPLAAHCLRADSPLCMTFYLTFVPHALEAAEPPKE